MRKLNAVIAVLGIVGAASLTPVFAGSVLNPDVKCTDFSAYKKHGPFDHATARAGVNGKYNSGPYSQYGKKFKDDYRAKHPRK